MDQETLLRETYHQERRQLEEKEEEQKICQRKAQYLAEETYAHVRAAMRTFEHAGEALQFFRKELTHVEGDLQFKLTQERKKLHRQQEEAEHTYRRALAQLHSR